MRGRGLQDCVAHSRCLARVLGSSDTGIAVMTPASARTGLIREIDDRNQDLDDRANTWREEPFTIAYDVRSSSTASGAFFRTESTPPRADDLLLYASLTAIISPFPAFSLKRYLSAWSWYTSNLPATAHSFYGAASDQKLTTEDGHDTNVR